MAASRQALIRSVWPDKVMFGCIMLFITGILGLLYGLVLLAIGATIDTRNIPRFFADYPAGATTFFSAAAILLAYLAWRQRRTRWAVVGCIAGFLSFALIGIASLFSLLALGFVLQARREGEDAAAGSAPLTADMWPDKSLAASLFLLMGGVITLLWGFALFRDAVTFGGYESTFGVAGLAGGALAVVASYLVYHQRGAILGFVAAVVGLVSLGLYVLGPILFLAALYLLWQAWQEDEFRAST